MWVISWMMAGVLLAGLGIILARLSRRHASQGRNLDCVDGAAAVHDIISRSMGERSRYEIVLAGGDPEMTIEGIPTDWAAADTFLVEPLVHLPAGLELGGLPATVYFHIGKMERLEPFYFHTEAAGLERRDAGGARRVYLRLRAPVRLYRGQRRRHFRLRPGRAAQVLVDLALEVEPGVERKLVRRVPAADISAGGLRLLVEEGGGLGDLQPGAPVLLALRFRPSTFAAEGARVPPVVRFRAIVRENRSPAPGQRLMRLQFVAREVDPGDGKGPLFLDDLESINEDICRWIHACQRRLLRERRLPPSRRPPGRPAAGEPFSLTSG